MKPWSVVAERFIRTLENKFYEYMTSISKRVCIDKLDDIVNKYNNTYHRIIKMKLLHVNPTYIFTLIKKTIGKVFLKLIIMLEYQNIKNFLQKAVF